MAHELSEFQKKTKAQNIIERQALGEDLNAIQKTIGRLFSDSPIAVAETISREELEELIVEINKGTATNNKIARFLELASQLGIA